MQEERLEKGSSSTFRRIMQALRTNQRMPVALVFIGPAFLVGVGGGLGAIAFRWLITSVTRVSFEWLPRFTQALGSDIHLILAPTLGGLLVGYLVTHYAPEAKGHGVPEVMEAVALRGGRIRPIVALIKSLASAICIGSGGSVGREGPIVQIGSALGSTLGQKLNLSEDRIRNLVACGAAAGISATFNAPIAGLIFAMEVILGDFGVRNFTSVAIAAVTADVIGRIAFGNIPAFQVPEYQLHSLWEYPLYVGLGVLAAGIAVFYVRAVYQTEAIFERSRRIPATLQPALGGLLLGLLAWVYTRLPAFSGDPIPHIYGVGYETISLALLGGLSLGLATILMLLKIAGTSLTLGSGGSGGIFAPSLFIGATLGAGFGRWLEMIIPGVTAPAGAYALVGMGAVFAAAAHAPITAVLILFELTDDYRIILPLILAAGVATVLSHHWLEGESIYTLKLTRRGIRLRFGRDIDIMESVLVEEVMSRDAHPLPPEFPAKALPELFLRYNSHAFPITDAEHHLLGMVSLSDYRRAAQSYPSLDDLRVIDIGTREPSVAYPDENLRSVLRRMAPRDLSRMPVVNRDDARRLVGVIRRNDIIRAYERASAGRAQRTFRGMPKLPGSEVAEFFVLEQSPIHGKRLAEIRLPRECAVVGIVRNGELIVPHGDTDLLAGDQVMILLGKCRQDELQRFFNPSAKDGEAASGAGEGSGGRSQI